MRLWRWRQASAEQGAHLGDSQGPGAELAQGCGDLVGREDGIEVPTAKDAAHLDEECLRGPGNGVGREQAAQGSAPVVSAISSTPAEASMTTGVKPRRPPVPLQACLPP